MREVRSTQTEYLPLFESARKAARKPAPANRVEWARELLVNSKQLTFDVNVLRMFIAAQDPDLIGDGLWLGVVFQSPLFEKVGPSSSTRPAAKGRTVWEYRLSAEGLARRQQHVTGQAPKTTEEL